MPLYSFQGKTPQIHPSVFIAQTAAVIGSVTIGEGSNIWPGAVIRGDYNVITIGKYTSIQDNVVIHGSVKIGDHVRVGHGAVIHAAIIESNTLIGMNSVLLRGSIIRKNSTVGAGAVVLEDTEIPANCLAAGNPAKIVKRLIASEQEKRAQRSSFAYFQLGQQYKREEIIDEQPDAT